MADLAMVDRRRRPWSPCWPQRLGVDASAGAERRVAEAFDVVVVGAGPAGSAAALVAARAGRSVCLLERGPFPGSKNMYGGVSYGRVLDDLIPRWWEEAPVQRWVTRRSTMVATADQAVTVDVRTEAWGRPALQRGHHLPLRVRRLAGRQGGRGRGHPGHRAPRPSGCCADPTAAVAGVRTDRPDGDIGAQVVIACDGVNSFLAKEAGLYPDFSSRALHARGQGGAAPWARRRSTAASAWSDRQGIDIEMVGVTRGIPGGGFLYTNLDTVAVGRGGQRRRARRRPRCGPRSSSPASRRHPAIAPTCVGAELKEYTAHLIPEGGYDAMPELVADGMLVAGDAGGLCLAAGLFLEGVNFAIGSGRAAAETAVEAIAAAGHLDRRPGRLPAPARGELRPGRPQEDAPGPRAGALRPHAAALRRADLRRGRGPVHRHQPRAQAGLPVCCAREAAAPGALARPGPRRHHACARSGEPRTVGMRAGPSRDMETARDMETPERRLRGPDGHGGVPGGARAAHRRRQRRLCRAAPPRPASPPARPTSSSRRPTAGSCSTTSSASSAAPATWCATRRGPSAGPTRWAATASSSGGRE